jgi:predicted  nucleic acid-binding Zn-ribbon protein
VADEPKPRRIETVRCLHCGARYAKPLGGGTVRANPGCPDCGYVGWVLAGPVTEFEPRPTSEDRQRRRSA